MLQDLAFEAIVIERMGRTAGHVREIVVMVLRFMRVATWPPAFVMVLRSHEMMQLVPEHLEWQGRTRKEQRQYHITDDPPTEAPQSLAEHAGRSR